MKNDKFIRENNEKKALKLAYKKLLERINDELTKSRRLFGGNVKRIIVLGKNNARLLFAVLEKNLDGENPLDLKNLDFFDFESSKLQLWGCPIYVADGENIVMVVASLGNLVDNSFMEPFITLSTNTTINPYVDMDALIDKLPKEAKFKRI